MAQGILILAAVYVVIVVAFAASMAILGLDENLRMQHTNYPMTWDKITETRERLSKLTTRVSLVLQEQFGDDWALCDGALLGYIRENNFLAWDDDLDFRHKGSLQPYIDTLRKEGKNSYIDDRYQLRWVQSEANDRWWQFFPDGDTQLPEIHGDAVTLDIADHMGEPWGTDISDLILPSQSATINGATTRFPVKAIDVLNRLYGPSWFIPQIYTVQHTCLKYGLWALVGVSGFILLILILSIARQWSTNPAS
jgi:hypothetical protein